MLRIILSPILVIITVLLIPSVSKAIFFLPLIFALSISLVNLDKLKSKSSFVGILLSIAQSYGVFLGLAIVVFYLDEFSEDISLLSNQNFPLKGIILVTLGGYLAALLLFYFFRFLFKVPQKQFSFFSITICYALVILVMQLFSKNEFLQFGVDKFASFLISWVIFMSLGFAIALNKNTFDQLLKGK